MELPRVRPYPDPPRSSSPPSSPVSPSAPSPAHAVGGAPGTCTPETASRSWNSAAVPRRIAASVLQLECHLSPSSIPVRLTPAEITRDVDLPNNWPLFLSLCSHLQPPPLSPSVCARLRRPLILLFRARDPCHNRLREPQLRQRRTRFIKVRRQHPQLSEQMAHRREDDPRRRSLW